MATYLPLAASRCPPRHLVLKILLTLLSLWGWGTVRPLHAQVLAPNPDLTPACGLDVILILDESASIGNDAEAVRQGARALLESIADTGSRVALIEFNSVARLPLGVQYLDVTTGPGGSLSPGGPFDLYLTTGYNPSDSTNWEDALLKAQQINNTLGVAPLLVFFTDGNPNNYIDDNGNVASDTEANALAQAQAAANVLKNQGSHLFVAGVSAVTEANLLFISGPDKSPDSGKPFGENDYTLTSFNRLESALRIVAFNLCAPSLTLTKFVDEGNGHGYLPAAGWGFTGRVRIDELGQAADAFDWVKPSAGAASQLGQTQSASSGSDGLAQWQWTPGSRQAPQQWVSQFLLAEQGQGGYALVDTQCQRKTLEPEDGGFSESNFTLTTLPASIAFGPNDVVTCAVRNAKTAIAVGKTPSVSSLPEPGGTVDYTFTVTNTGALSVTLSGLVDSIFGNLHGQGNCVANGSVNLAPNALYQCVVSKTISGNAGLNHTNVVTATAQPRLGLPIQAITSASVRLTDVPSSLQTTITAQRTSVLAPGADVEFTIAVKNSSRVDTVTLTGVTVTPFGDVAASCLPRLPIDLLPGATVTCTFTHFVGGAPGDLITVVATASGVDDDGDNVSASDQDELQVSRIAASIRVTKVASVAEVPETGASVVFTVTVENSNAQEIVTINTVDDQPVGNLQPYCNRPLPATLPSGTKMTCSYAVAIGGKAGTVYTNTVIARGVDSQGQPVSDQDQASVRFLDLIPEVVVNKNATPAAVLDSGGEVTFSVVVINRGPEAGTLTALIDSIFGDLNGQGTCAVPQPLAGNGGTYACSFKATVAGSAQIPHRNTVTARVSDDDGNTGQAAGSATVNFILTNPALVVTKRDVLQVDHFDKPEEQGIITPADTLRYDLTVRNQGNAAANNVVIEDNPDPNSQLLIGTVTTSKGVVTTGDQAGDQKVVIAIGSLAIGESVNISFQVLITKGTGATLLRNQAFVRNPQQDAPGGVGITISDDPDTPNLNGDATETRVVIIPTGLGEGEEPLRTTYRSFLPLLRR